MPCTTLRYGTIHLKRYLSLVSIFLVSTATLGQTRSDVPRDSCVAQSDTLSRDIKKQISSLQNSSCDLLRSGKDSATEPGIFSADAKFPCGKSERSSCRDVAVASSSSDNQFALLSEGTLALGARLKSLRDAKESISFKPT